MTKVKICGITNIDDGRCAVAAGADFLGFVFYPPSPRYVSPEIARDIITRVKDEATRPVQMVGIFVNHALETVQTIMAQAAIDLAQLHGDEAPAFLAQFEGRAFKAANPQSLEEATQLSQQFLTGVPVGTTETAPFILLDAYHPNLRGGTGHTGDWGIVAEIARNQNVILAGGLTPDNVSQAVQQVRPWGVDVSSGVEAQKGVKDHAKVRGFVAAVKNNEQNN